MLCCCKNMLNVWDLYVAGMVLVWALLLGIINMRNKLYFFMFMWIVLTYVIASAGAVRLVFFIMQWAALATIALGMFERLFLAAIARLQRAENHLTLFRVVRRARVAAGAA